MIDVATRGGVNHELNGSDWVHWGTNLYLIALIDRGDTICAEFHEHHVPSP